MHHKTKGRCNALCMIYYSQIKYSKLLHNIFKTTSAVWYSQNLPISVNYQTIWIANTSTFFCAIYNPAVFAFETSMNIRTGILRKQKQKWDLKNTNSLGRWWVIIRIELLVIVTHNMLCGYNTLCIMYCANRPWCYRIIAKYLANQLKFTLPKISWKLLLWFQEK